MDQINQELSVQNQESFTSIHNMLSPAKKLLYLAVNECNEMAEWESRQVAHFGQTIHLHEAEFERTSYPLPHYFEMVNI